MKLTELFFDPQLRKMRILIATVFFLLYLILPLSAVQVKTYDREEYINDGHCYEFEIEVQELLDIARNPSDASIIIGRYYLVNNIHDGPGEQFALFVPSYLIDSPPDHFVGYGDLMEPYSYFGEEYIFYDDYIEIRLHEIRDWLFWEDQTRDLIWMYSNPVNPFNSILSFSGAVFVAENGLDGFYESFIAFWSFITLMFQVISVYKFAKILIRKQYSSDQRLFLISTYFLICVLFILPLLPIQNADPFWF